MPRIFYTERDIEDLARTGVREIEVNDDVYLTDLALEKMEALGIKTRNAARGGPAPRPSSAPATTPGAPLTDAEKQALAEKVKKGVIARLGPGVDAALVDSVVRRVVGQL